MSLGLSLYTSVGTGTLTNSSGAYVATITPNASTLQGDLVVALITAGSTGAFTWIPGDGGDPWIILAQGNDQSGFEAALMAACIAPRAGSSGWASIRLADAGGGNVGYVAQVQTYRLVQPAGWGLAQFGGAPIIYNSASGTNADAPAINQSYQQVIDLLGRTYYTTASATVGAIAGFTENFDVNNTTGRGGLVLNSRQLTGAVQNPLVTSAISAAKTLKYGFRAMIPILGNGDDRRRLQGNRRLFG